MLLRKLSANRNNQSWLLKTWPVFQTGFRGEGGTEYTLTIQESRGVETCSSPHAADHDVTYRRIRFSSDHDSLHMIFLVYRVLDLGCGSIKRSWFERDCHKVRINGYNIHFRGHRTQIRSVVLQWEKVSWEKGNNIATFKIITLMLTTNTNHDVKKNS